MRRNRNDREAQPRHDRGGRERFGSKAVAGRGAAEGEPSAFKREASGVSRQEPEHATGMREPENVHVPVLSDEVTFLLHPRRGGWVVDGTIGMGGHAERLLETAGGDTRLLGIDRDPEALARAARRLASFGARLVLPPRAFPPPPPLPPRAALHPAAAVLL